MKSLHRAFLGRLALLATALSVSGLTACNDVGQVDERPGSRSLNSNEIALAATEPGLASEEAESVILHAPPLAAAPSAKTADTFASLAAISGTAITLSPASASSAAASSTTVTVSGSNYNPNQTITLTWDGSKSLGTVTSNSTGAFSTTFTVPSPIDGGNYTVLAKDESDGSASAIMKLVDPSLSLSSSSATPGARSP